MNIFLQELKMMRSSLLAWTSTFLLLNLMFFSLYPVFHQDVAASQALLEKFPPAVKQMFSINFDTFFSFLGFYIYTFTFISLIAAIQALNIGLSLLSKEVSSKTSDFLLSKPVSRTRIFTAKVLAGVGVLLATITLFTLAGLGLSYAFNVGDYSIGSFLLINLALFLTQLVFLSVGLVLSQVIRRLRSVISVSLGVAFGFFALDLIGSISEDEKFRYFTPFKFFDYTNIAQTGGYQISSIVLVVVSLLLTGGAAYYLYTRRDARSVT